MLSSLMVTVLGNKELRQSNEAFSIRHVETLPVRQYTCHSSQYAYCYCSLIFCLLNGWAEGGQMTVWPSVAMTTLKRLMELEKKVEEVKPWPLVQVLQLTVISSESIHY